MPGPDNAYPSNNLASMDIYLFIYFIIITLNKFRNSGCFQQRRRSEMHIGRCWIARVFESIAAVLERHAHVSRVHWVGNDLFEEHRVYRRAERVWFQNATRERCADAAVHTSRRRCFISIVVLVVFHRCTARCCQFNSIKTGFFSYIINFYLFRFQWFKHRVSMQSLHSITIQIYDVVPHDETPTNYILKRFY